MEGISSLDTVMGNAMVQVAIHRTAALGEKAMKRVSFEMARNKDRMTNSAFGFLKGGVCVRGKTSLQSGDVRK